jgi:hypothetical protein
MRRDTIDFLLGAASAAVCVRGGYQAGRGNTQTHRHLFVVHRHPEWPCHPNSGRLHCHVWWEHSHQHDELVVRFKQNAAKGAVLVLSDAPDHSEVLAALNRAYDEVVRLCMPGNNGWRMSVPADPARDSDLIIANALDLALKALAPDAAPVEVVGRTQ